MAFVKTNTTTPATVVVVAVPVSQEKSAVTVHVPKTSKATPNTVVNAALSVMQANPAVMAFVEIPAIPPKHAEAVPSHVSLAKLVAVGPVWIFLKTKTTVADAA